MTKKDLRTGMVVETRDGRHYLVLAEHEELVSETSHMEYRSHNDDLTYTRHNKFDIMKVYSPHITGFKWMMEELGTPIWERPTYYNGKVVCVDNDDLIALYTVGKIYEFKNGKFVDDSGYERPSSRKVTTLEDFHENCTHAKFIEVVE